MNLVLLTTETLHHSWFLRELSRRHPVARVFVETETLRPAYETAHPFEAERDEHERALWFAKGGERLSDHGDTMAFPSLNAESAVAALRQTRPDLAVVFGTGKLSQAVIDACGGNILNLHGGDPEEYRGLDTHLWAVWHGAFDQLSTTLHWLAPELDTGAIVGRRPILLTNGMTLAQLRAANTRVCLQLVEDALDGWVGGRGIPAQPQARRGRYYSFMPTALKQVCVRRFAMFSGAMR
ncbi:hypothetical protein D3877_28385 [Azospirillum cavernae]|uniref:phosphoribosylglycinamide formyltransferase 1 n=1 Tax=Azospirillum cavernae TaxID=2320860 RepID=A0A418VKY3_9PROT|nr:formyltransferase family protein [Azospirillum cavernae]RJF76805.1 hypothetical protein D3877_28385 [Azospirillum cavernae]